MYQQIKEILDDYSQNLGIELEKYCNSKGKFSYIQIWNLVKDKHLDALLDKSEVEEILLKCLNFKKS